MVCAPFKKPSTRKVASILTFLVILACASMSIPGNSSLSVTVEFQCLCTTLLPDVMHVMNFTRLPHFSVCIIEKLGGTWVQGYDYVSQDTCILQVQGIKGPSVLSLHPLFQLPWGVIVDDLHCLYLGVASHLIELWFDKKYRDKDHYIGQKVQCTTNCLLIMLCNLRPKLCA